MELSSGDEYIAKTRQDWRAVRQHVEVGVKEGMRETGRERETRGTSHRLSGGRGRAARRVVAGASIEAGVAKCVRVCWGKTTRYAEDEGEAAGSLHFR
jgi:hypothetical protein